MLERVMTLACNCTHVHTSPTSLRTQAMGGDFTLSHLEQNTSANLHITLVLKPNALSDGSPFSSSDFHPSRAFLLRKISRIARESSKDSAKGPSNVHGFGIALQVIALITDRAALLVYVNTAHAGPQPQLRRYEVRAVQCTCYINKRSIGLCCLGRGPSQTVSAQNFEQQTFDQNVFKSSCCACIWKLAWLNNCIYWPCTLVWPWQATSSHEPLTPQRIQRA